VNKTKIMVFGFGKLRQNLKFTPKAFNCTWRSSADSANKIVSSAYNITNILR
jgi:hypothetical protein